MTDQTAEARVRSFYDSAGWSQDDEGNFVDANLWEDLRPVARAYVSACRMRVARELPRAGDRLMDAASGPVQYPEYLEFSAGFRTRVCVDISQKALDAAKRKLGERGEYVCASLLELPFADDSMDASVSLHTIYHIDREDQERAVREIIRVTKPGAPIVIVYANPDHATARAERALRALAFPAVAAVRLARRLRGTKVVSPDAGYYHAHPLSFWDRFRDRCEVDVKPWRTLIASESKRAFPESPLGAFLFDKTLAFEERYPEIAVRAGAYPMIVMRKQR